MRLASLALGLAVVLAACDGGRSQPPPLDPPSVERSPSGGACGRITLDAVVAMRFEVDGTCLDGDDLIQYRCSPGAVPVLRIASADGPALFLGGPFAVPVKTLPAQVRFAGVAAEGTEVLIADPVAPSGSPSPSGAPAGSPSSPSPSLSASVEATLTPAPALEPQPLVYVREGGVTERWLRLVGRRAVSEPPVVWLIGDSILDGGRDIVEAELADWSLTLDAEVGRPSSSGIGLAVDAVEQDADAVVVELGTNDVSSAAFREHLIETLDLLASVPLVVWQTTRGPAGDPRIEAVNAAIREVVPTYPNAAIADWEVFVPQEAVLEDGIHPDEGFLHLEAELLVPILSAWRGAVSREGATSCGRRVVRETS